MEKIKLIIWDLDDTFWSGTLSEGEITPLSKNIELVKQLSEKGIVNSISSKNDFKQARKKLEELKIWDYFIFPSINWNPKGENVKQIINNCQLRNVNVLFIDDNISNRKEVEYYNNGIQTIHPNEINKIITKDILNLKSDVLLTRLQQYKILEKKKEFQLECSDNYSFLQQSSIKISFIKDLKKEKKRILELIERTNQLNFTKKRISDIELDKLLNDNNIECSIIKVSDRFGDYGICGFYAYDSKIHNLIHLYSHVES